MGHKKIITVYSDTPYDGVIYECPIGMIVPIDLPDDGDIIMTVSAENDTDMLIHLN